MLTVQSRDEDQILVHIIDLLTNSGFKVNSEVNLPGYEFQPDILASRKGKTFAIEYKGSLIGYTDILDVCDLPVKKSFIITVDDPKKSTSASIREYAKIQEVGLIDTSHLETLVDEMNDVIDASKKSEANAH